MRIYYLEDPLSDEDVQFVSESLKLPARAEQVRIPYVLPVITALDETGLDEMLMHRRHAELLRGHLRRAGIEKDQGHQVGFVAPKDMHWYSVLMSAIVAETGLYPYMIQTAAQRAAMNNPGMIRVLDTEGLMGGKG